MSSWQERPLSDPGISAALTSLGNVLFIRPHRQERPLGDPGISSGVTSSGDVLFIGPREMGPNRSNVRSRGSPKSCPRDRRAYKFQKLEARELGQIQREHPLMRGTAYSPYFQSFDIFHLVQGVIHPVWMTVVNWPMENLKRSPAALDPIWSQCSTWKKHSPESFYLPHSACHFLDLRTSDIKKLQAR